MEINRVIFNVYYFLRNLGIGGTEYYWKEFLQYNEYGNNKNADKELIIKN
jgi:hypothetical protein